MSIKTLIFTLGFMTAFGSSLAFGENKAVCSLKNDASAWMYPFTIVLDAPGDHVDIDSYIDPYAVVDRLASLSNAGRCSLDRAQINQFAQDHFQNSDYVLKWLDQMVQANYREEK
jgi:hypothetical protein